MCRYSTTFTVTADPFSFREKYGQMMPLACTIFSNDTAGAELAIKEYMYLFNQKLAVLELQVSAPELHSRKYS